MSNRTIAALAVLGGSAALAAGLVVPAGATPSRSSVAHGTTYLDSTGTTGSDVIRLTAHLPAALGPIPQDLDLGLLDVEGTSVREPSKGTHSSKAFSGLLAPTGTQLDALDALKAQASSASGTKSASLPGSALPDTHGLLTGSLLTGKATVDTSTDDSTSDISITDLGALQLGQLLGASTVQQIQDQVNQVLAAANTIISALQPLENLSPNIKQTVTALQNLVKELQDTDLTKVAVATVGTLTGKQSILHNASGAPTAQATTELEDLNILDGLLHVQAVKTSSTAKAAGTPGTGSASGHALVGKVTVGNSGLTATIGQAGKLLKLTLPFLTKAQQQQLNGALDQLQSTLQTLLSTIGITTKPGDVTKNVASNGTAASAAASGLLVTVAPGGTKVLTLAIGTSAASVNASKVTTGAPVQAPPPPSKPGLPATGGSPLPAGLGLGLAGLGLAALAVRRRVRS